MNDSDLKMFFSEIKVSIVDYYTNVQQLNVKEIILKKIIERPFSCVAFVEVHFNGSMVDLVAKKVVHHEINKQITSFQNQAVVEYDILKQLYHKFVEVPGCAVPEAILVEPAMEAYVMKFVPGELLVEQFKYCRYFSSRKKTKQLIESWRNCGKWLKKFQEITGTSLVNNRDYIGGVIDRAMHRLFLIDQLNDSRVPKGFSKVIATFLDNHQQELGNEKILVSGRHGDFIPLNMIVDGSNITVIDYLGYRREPIAVDVLKVLVNLHDEMRSLTSSNRRVQLLKEAFVAGYGKLPNQPYQLLYLCEAMQRIVSLWGNLSRNNCFLHHKIENSVCIRSHVKWLMNEGNVKLAWAS